MIDFEFRDEVLKEIPELKRCFQCGICVSSCFAEKYIGSYSPRRKILSALYGHKDILNEELWKCVACNSCNERCPRDVNPYEILVKLKNICVREEIVSKEEGTEAIDGTSFALVVNESVNRIRKELGLKELKGSNKLKKLI